MNPLRPTLGCCGVRQKPPKAEPTYANGTLPHGGANFDAELALYEAEDAQLEPVFNGVSGRSLLEHRRRMRQSSAGELSTGAGGRSGGAPQPVDEPEDGEQQLNRQSIGASKLMASSRAAGAPQGVASGAGGAAPLGRTSAASSFFAPSAAAAGKEHVAVVQGASGGIGLELVTQLLERRDLKARSGASLCRGTQPFTVVYSLSRAHRGPCDRHV